MTWKWYSVKTIYRSDVSGTPKKIDASYSDHATFVEERIVLFKARSFDEAISKAEMEAKNYVKGTHRNAYGQTVRARYLKAFDAFELYDEPGSGVEVFSSTEVTPRAISNKEVISRRLGQMETKIMKQNRKLFRNAEMQNITDPELRRLIEQ